MEEKKDVWTPSDSEIELLRIFAARSDEATALFKAKIEQVAIGLGVSRDEWESQAVFFDWKAFRRKPKDEAK